MQEFVSVEMQRPGFFAKWVCSVLLFSPPYLCTMWSRPDSTGPWHGSQQWWHYFLKAKVLGRQMCQKAANAISAPGATLASMLECNHRQSIRSVLRMRLVLCLSNLMHAQGAQRIRVLLSFGTRILGPLTAHTLALESQFSLRRDTVHRWIQQLFSAQCATTALACLLLRILSLWVSCWQCIGVCAHVVTPSNFNWRLILCIHAPCVTPGPSSLFCFDELWYFRNFRYSLCKWV